MKKNVLVIITITSQFRALLPIIQLLKKSNNYEPIVLFDENRHDLSVDINFCRTNRLRYVSKNNILPYNYIKEEDNIGNDKFNNVEKKSIIKVSIKKFLLKYIKKNKLLNYYSFIYFTKKRAKKILISNDIYHLISGADVEMEVSCFVNAANALNINTWVYPFSLSSQGETTGAVYEMKNMKINNSIFKLFIRLFYKKWIYKIIDGYYLKDDFYKIAAIEFFNISPTDPWIYIGGKSKYVLIESEFVRDYYKKAGVTSNRFIEIGAPFLCNLMKVSSSLIVDRVQVFKKYGLSLDKKIILCAMPPINFGPNEVCLDSKEYRTVGEMVEDWILTITSNDNYQVILNLHPRTDLNKAKFIEQYNVKIIHNDISNLIPLCDLFVSNASATIRMALAMNKPVLDYDMQNFCYPNYENLALVTSVFDKSSFHERFVDITRRNYFDERIKQLGEKPNNYFGELNCSFENKFISILEKYEH